MKILHVTPSYHPTVGGIENLIRNLCAHLRKRGLVSDVMHISPDHHEISQDCVDDGLVWRVPLFPNRLVGVTPPLTNLFLGYDLLHVHDPQLMAITGNVMFWGRRKAKILNTLGGYFHTKKYGAWKRVHWHVFAEPILRRYDAVLASSVADFELFKTKASNLSLVPCGVNVDKFLQIKRKDLQSPTRWIYWGRLSANKRIDAVINLVADLRKVDLEIDLVIAGEDFDGLSSALQTRITNHGLNDQVRLVGPLADVELLKALSTRSVFVTASEHEGFGLGLIEAMAAGLLVISRDISPMNGFVTRSRTGELIDFDGSRQDLAVVAALCSKAPAELETMTEQARQAARAYGWDQVIDRYIRAYEDVVGANDDRETWANVF